MACPKGRAVHYIFSFPKEGKEKDAISIPHADTFSQQYSQLFQGFKQKNSPNKAVFLKILTILNHNLIN
ncbi:hypothetical protein C8P67_1103 [Flavobacterium aquicola]|uniref:Uncharacterized protein n=1 Tax=Flavobacterium aquicola TaxID=1682742 RepID=A0A3E0ED60_9FLAO|nr:hypothetical protein C8P67_1103 [Flavobacterium aquicola]